MKSDWKDTDIEETKRLFAVLEQAKREWETTFDAIEDGIAILTREGTIKRVNAAMAGMLAMDIRELPGRRCCDLFPHHNEMGCPARITSGHRVIEFEVGVPWKRVYRESSYSVPGIGSVVVIIQDITSQKLAEDRIRRLAEEAVQANRELIESMRKLKATQERLVASEKLASLATMAAGLAHEINNPLSFVLSGLGHVTAWAEGVMRFFEAFRSGKERRDLEQIMASEGLDGLGEDIRAVLSDMKAGLERIHRIIKAISSFVEHGTLDFEEVDLNGVIREAVALLEEDLPEGVEIVLHLSEVPKVFGSSVGLRTAISHLVENAVYGVTRTGKGGRVEIASMKRGDSVVVNIKDNGIGMSKDVLARAMDPFFTTRAPGPHVGLGLSIAQAVVRRHGGDLTIHSKEGEGTTVEFFVPIEMRVEEEPSKAHRLASRT